MCTFIVCILEKIMFKIILEEVDEISVDELT
jgi:hypothetical protein